jgi:hypothetical protein
LGWMLSIGGCTFRAAHASTATIQYVRVDHGGLNCQRRSRRTLGSFRVGDDPGVERLRSTLRRLSWPAAIFRKADGPSGDIERYIEANATAGQWDIVGVGLSKEQFECAFAKKEKYWLYIVERAERDDYRIYRIQDPARKAGQFFYDDGWAGRRE